MENIKTCNPQLENGHTRIANELLEAILVYPFSANETRIVFAVIRKTYGWGKKQALISYGQLKDATGKDIRTIKKAVKKLVQDRVILKYTVAGKNTLSLNKHYLDWKMWISAKDQWPTGHRVVVNKTPGWCPGRHQGRIFLFL